MNFLTEQVRAYLYRVALVVLVVLVAYDVIGEGEVAMWTEVVAAVLAVGSAGLATANTSTKSQ
jgi:hypothetical protein